MSQDLVEQAEETQPDGVDLVSARRWARTLRRIDRIEFTGTHALIHGAGHRLPTTRRVPARVGRALVALGYPATERRAG